MTKTKSISLAILVAGLYSVLSVALAPISFGPVQLRIADSLLPLAALFGWPVIWGVTLGCFIGNMAGGIIYFGSFTLLDVLLGPIANLLSASIIFYLKSRRLLACVLGSITVGMIVGGYLWLLIPPPEILGSAVPLWASMILSITLSSLVTIAVIGYVLLCILSRPSMIRLFKAMGVETTEK